MDVKTNIELINFIATLQSESLDGYLSMPTGFVGSTDIQMGRSIYLYT